MSLQPHRRIKTSCTNRIVIIMLTHLNQHISCELVSLPLKASDLKLHCLGNVFENGFIKTWSKWLTYWMTSCHQNDSSYCYVIIIIRCTAYRLYIWCYSVYIPNFIKFYWDICQINLFWLYFLCGLQAANMLQSKISFLGNLWKLIFENI